jgi:acyl dehydratase
MMATRELNSTPRILPLYARVMAPLLPGASRLPWVGGGGGEIPELELVLAKVQVDSRHVADYCRVCGFSPGVQVPASYPHVLAFPLHLALMADPHFPFGAVGLVHVANRIVQHRPIEREAQLELRVRATPLEDHPRGRSFSLRSEARIADELVWEELSTMLHREQRTDAAPVRDEQWEPPSSSSSSEWRLPGDLGRRYAAVSGDRNPIHLHALTARPLGFPRAIAHGMWTKARCLAALEQRLPGAFSVDVRFRRPILLPATVGFGSAPEEKAIRFWVHDMSSDTSHLEGRVQPISATAEQGGQNK